MTDTPKPYRYAVVTREHGTVLGLYQDREGADAHAVGIKHEAVFVQDLAEMGDLEEMWLPRGKENDA